MKKVENLRGFLVAVLFFFLGGEGGIVLNDFFFFKNTSYLSEGKMVVVISHFLQIACVSLADF